jgi:hypothetical protein
MNQDRGSRDTNRSVLGRLLEELSWEGKTIREYRDGERGFENVLTAEALQGLDFLPRTAFLGQVIDAAHGANETRARLVAEIEEAVVTLLPGGQRLNGPAPPRGTELTVQPDGLIESRGVYAVLEAKRIRRNSFQREQLAREYVLALRDANERAPLLLLILSDEPPVKVAGQSRMSITDAIGLALDSVLERSDGHGLARQEAIERIPQIVAWLTWSEISEIVRRQQAVAVSRAEASVGASIQRLADSVTHAIERHG